MCYWQYLEYEPKGEEMEMTQAELAALADAKFRNDIKKIKEHLDWFKDQYRKQSLINSELTQRVRNIEARRNYERSFLNYSRN